ncbi:MAG TPA: hypothetical protein VIM11_26755 [Tepidisphaeraceae bacterium]|jgi:hypothetical protein
MRDFWFTGKMENVPPQPMLSPAEHRLKRVALLDPAYKPLTDAVKPYLAEWIAAMGTVHSADEGKAFAAVHAKQPNIAQVIQAFVKFSGGTVEHSTRILFGLPYTEKFLTGTLA